MNRLASTGEFESQADHFHDAGLDEMRGDRFGDDVCIDECAQVGDNARVVNKACIGGTAIIAAT